jgi:uncharacterized RDD family membrane protein YckC
MEQQFVPTETIYQQTEPAFDTLEPATVGQRFLNYIIDVIVLYVVAFGMATMLLVLMYATGKDTNEDGAFQELFLLLWVFLIVLYYTFAEGASQGRSIGKLITRTKVVREDGSEISWKDAFVRSLCRIIPFEPFTAFNGYPLHDRISHTKVIKITKKQVRTF